MARARSGARTSPPFEAYTGVAPYIFVSYAHGDDESVYPEIARLRQLGFRIWYDEGIRPTSDWTEGVAAALGGCALFLVFLSPRSIQSRNVLNEIHFALDRSKPFLAVHLAEVELPDNLQLQVGRIQAIMRYRLGEDSYRRQLERWLPPELAEPAAGLGEGGPAAAAPPRAETPRDRRPGVLHLRLIAIHVSALSAAVLALTVLRERVRYLVPGGDWLLFTIALLPLAAAFVGEVVPSWRRRQREVRILNVIKERPGYFRVGPYTADDHEQYVRADNAHKHVHAWLARTREPILYLTGLSGTGKSSLLYAYVLPELCETGGVRAIIVRSFHDPVEDLKSKLLQPKAVWERPPPGGHDVRAILKAAAEHLRPTRLLVVFDQFEEFLIIHQRHPERVKTLGDLLALLRQDPIAGVVTLLVVRSDYLAKLQELLLQADLPALRQDENWKEISAFSERHAREFLANSGLQIGPDLTDDLFREIGRIEETVGLVRPITLNMVGLVLDRSALSKERSLPVGRRRSGLVLDYLWSCIGRSDVRDHARDVLRPMITSAATKQPRSVSELAGETGFPEGVVTGCLLLLGKDGLVRQIDASENVWEISHDFVARLLGNVLGSWRPGRLQAALPWLTPAALVIWMGMYLALPSLYKPWYKKFTDEQIRQEDFITLEEGSETMSCLHLAARNGDRDAAEHFLNRGAAIDARDKPQGRTPLRLAAENKHFEVVKLLVDKDADINAKTRDGDTALHRAAVFGQLEQVELLIKYGADVWARDNYDYIPLHSAVFRAYNPRLIEVLIAHRPDTVKARDLFGMTPLHIAALRNHDKAVVILLDKGADPHAKDSFQNTPLAYAGKHRDGRAAAILQKAARRK